MSLAILFHFLCVQHVSDINVSIIRSLRLFCCITTLVVLFLVRCVLEFRCGWVGGVSVLQAASACNTDTTPTQPHRNSNTDRTKNNTTNVVIQQNNRKLLMMDIFMSETYWAHEKWNKIPIDIKLVFFTSTNFLKYAKVTSPSSLLPPFQISNELYSWLVISNGLTISHTISVNVWWSIYLVLYSTMCV